MSLTPCPWPCCGTLTEKCNRSQRYGFHCDSCGTLYAAIAHLRTDGTVIWIAARVSEDLRRVLDADTVHENLTRLEELGQTAVYGCSFVAEVVHPVDPSPPALS